MVKTVYESEIEQIALELLLDENGHTIDTHTGGLDCVCIAEISLRDTDTEISHCQSIRLSQR